ncbi:MAG TPA: deoxyribonuclease IV [Chthonomonadaceae bacterium]|nr:deoxyribonuclease IV [Chthonomonadaceae bacterium]
MSELSVSTPSEPDERPHPAPTLPDIDSDSSSRLLGAHMPTSGGLSSCLTAGKEIGCSAVQLFTGSPRQWSKPPLKEEEVRAFQDARERTGIPFTVAHDSYLINLAAPVPAVLERSREAFRGELDRAESLAIPWVVTHMGAHLDQGEEPALERLIRCLRDLLEETEREGYRVGIALETTAGQGTGLGWRFEELGRVLEGVGPDPRLGVCLDTCHVFAAGYDLRDEQTYEKTLGAFDTHIGLDKLKVIHANDSKKPLGSRVDRHEHIGQGEIGIPAFARLVTDPRLKHIPIVIETPDADTMHAVNLARLKRLAAGGELGMMVTVQFFGHYRDFMGEEPLAVCLPVGAEVRKLAAHLEERDGRLAGLERHCRFAINEEYADPDQVLMEGNTVAVLPPMSGG